MFANIITAWEQSKVPKQKRTQSTLYFTYFGRETMIAEEKMDWSKEGDI